MDKQKLVDEITRKLTDEGKLVEAGWTSLCYLVVSADASKLQLKEMRMAFFAGAQHMFGSIMTMMEEDAEPTDNDLKRMDLIDKELRNFLVEFKREHKL